MTWLVTGGAGYIGAHVVRAFDEVGLDARRRRRPVQRAPRLRARRTCPFVEGSILDTDLLVRDDRASTASRASSTSPASSTPGSRSSGRCTPTSRTSPARSACSQAMAGRPAWTRSCSPPAPPRSAPPTSTWSPRRPPTRPESPYGESKLIGEWLLRDQADATGLRHTSLRYFNVVGSGHRRRLRHQPAQPVPAGDRGARRGQTPRINGDDYATPDGTCVRDYVHVADLAVAHVAAAQALAAGERRSSRSTTSAAAPALGRGRSWTRWPQVTGIDFTPEVAPAPPRRPRPDRRLRRARRPRPRLADAPRPSTTWSRSAWPRPAAPRDRAEP